MRIILSIAIGSAIGGVLRYLIAHGLQHAGGWSFPAGTLAVNVIGCFAMGLLMPLFAGERQLSDAAQLGLFVGLLGGFTTFSAFGRETVELWQEGRLGAAATYVLASNLLGLGAVLVGVRLGSMVRSA